MTQNNPMYPSGGFGSNFPAAAPARTSGFAIASLICALLFCVPFATSALAVLLGLIALVLTGKPQVKGRGLAVAGLLLGISGIALWSFATYKIVEDFVRPIQSVVLFTGDLTNGNTTAAGTRTMPPFDNATLPGLIGKVSSLGAFKELVHDKSKGLPFERTVENNIKVYKFNGEAKFAKGVAMINIEVRQTPTGWKIARLDLSDPTGTTTAPSTQP